MQGLCDGVSHCATSLHRNSYIITLLSSSESVGLYWDLNTYYVEHVGSFFFVCITFFVFYRVACKKLQLSEHLFLH
jgi:hypothetical protein